MDYNKNVLTDSNLQQVIFNVLELLKSTVIATLGPNGKTSIISDENGNPYITKDGVSVIKKLSVEDEFSNTIIKLIRQAAEKTVEEAGDGTTTSTCLAVSLIEFYLNKPDSIYKLKETKNKLLKYLENKVIPIKEKDIFNIAKISSNNDVNMSKIIEKAFKHSNNVKLEIHNKEKDEFVETIGHKLESGYLNNVLVNNEKNNSIVLQNSKLFIYDGKLSDVNFIKKLFTNYNNVVIVAEDISQEIDYLIRHNYNKGKIQTGIIKSPGFATHRKSLLEDLATIFNTKVYSEYNVNDIFTNNKTLGTLNNIEIFKNYSLLEGKTNIDDIKKRVKNLESLYKESDEHSKILIKQRLDLLEGKMSLIKIGGNSSVEVKEKYDRYEDSVLAVKSAKESGILTGGGVLLNYFANQEGEYAEPYKVIYKIISKDVQDFTDVIDPYKVVKCAIENSASVAKTIINTSSIIKNNYGI